MSRVGRRKLELNHTMTFGEHLEALRWHLIRAVVGVGLCLLVCLIFGQRLLLFLLGPLQRALDAHNAGQIVVPAPLAGLVTFFQISMVGGLVLASPWVVYQLWGFVAPGLYPHEKRLVYRSLPLFLELFIAGAIFGWCVALPRSLDQGVGLEHQIAVANWATFALVFPTAFGVAAELPLAMIVVSRIGLVSGQSFRKYRKVAILVSAILSAILTPSPSPIDMILMLVPLLVLYEVGVVCVWLIERPAASGGTEASKEDSSDLLASFYLPLVTVRLCTAERVNPFDSRNRE